MASDSHRLHNTVHIQLIRKIKQLSWWKADRGIERKHIPLELILVERVSLFIIVTAVTQTGYRQGVVSQPWRQRSQYLLQLSQF